MEMKAKFVTAIIVAILLASMVSFISLAYASTATNPFVTDLIAGGGNPASAIDVGDVSIWNDEDYLYVKYETTDDWYLTETHLAVATTLSGIPQTKTGNPIPGKFAYSTCHSPPVTEYVYQIPQTWNDGDTLSIAAHAKVVKLIGDCSSWQWATEVIDHKQGTLVGGGPITDSARTDPAKALGAPDNTFYSLGFVSDGDGWIELGFGYPIYNGLNSDIRTIEITWGNRLAYPEETADVYVWPKGGTDWVYAGSVSNHDNSDGSSYVAIPEGITYVEKVKLVDTTSKDNFPPTQYPTADGFDLDAVGAHYLIMAEETAWGYGENFPGKNWATYITYGWEWSVRWPETGTAYIGYEDWTGGDFDYNDFGMSMVVTEFHTPSGIEEIDIRCQGLVKLAGWHHKIHLYWTDGVIGHVHLEEWSKDETVLYRTYEGDFTGSMDVLLFDDTAEDVGHITTVHITFEEPVTLTMNPPYDPYIYVYDTGLTYHITDTQSKTMPEGTADLPYILVVPVTWLPPAEGYAIWTVYGYFDDYYVYGSPENWYDNYTGPNPTVTSVPYP
jgi:hypothetical protein